MERYEIYAGNTLCAVYDGNLKVIDENIAPLYFNDFRSWVESRAISERRGYVARLLKSSASLPATAGAYETSLAVNCACVTDNYWVKETGSSLTYEDVYYDTYDGRFAKLALGIDTDMRNYCSAGRNPELTNIGDSNKAWVTDKSGTRWLYKKQWLTECYNEILASKIAGRLGINTVEYELVSKSEDPERGRWGLIRSRDFTQGRDINLEHASLILKHFGITEADIRGNAKVFCRFGCERDYLDIIYLDIITGNGDRHDRNYGIIRSRANGRVLGLAPNYDNNYAFTRDLPITAFSEAAAEWDYHPQVLLDEDIRALKDEMAVIGCDSEQQLRSVSWKQKSVAGEILKRRQLMDRSVMDAAIEQEELF